MQYRGNVLLRPKSDESKKKPGPLLLVYFMLATIDGKLNVSELKLYNVSFLGRCARMGNTPKLPSRTELEFLKSLWGLGREEE